MSNVRPRAGAGDIHIANAAYSGTVGLYTLSCLVIEGLSVKFIYSLELNFFTARPHCLRSIALPTAIPSLCPSVSHTLVPDPDELRQDHAVFTVR